MYPKNTIEIAFFEGRSFLSRCIRFFTKSPFSHAAYVVPDFAVYDTPPTNVAVSGIRSGIVLEAWKGHVRLTDLFSTHKPNTVIRTLSLQVTPEMQHKFTSCLTSKIGRKYDFMAILNFLFVHKVYDDPTRFFCSELIMYSLIEAGIITPRMFAKTTDMPDSARTSPGFLHNFLVALGAVPTAVCVTRNNGIYKLTGGLYEHITK